MYNEVITLVQQKKESDENGNIIVTESTSKDVFAELKSIGQSEFYQAQSSGLKPELKFVLSDYYDYSNEKKVVFEGHCYSVVRTYRDGTKIELTVGSDIIANT